MVKKIKSRIKMDTAALQILEDAPEDALVEWKEDILLVTKWNWSYQECLDFQKRAQNFIQHNRSKKVFIFTNHPHCFTLGRGNERGADHLADFDPALEKMLDFPIYKIHRGGGITFHYPGQWIFYPIVSINPSYSLEDHMCWLLNSVKKNLEKTFDIDKLLSAKKLMGVWRDRKKLASIGVGLNRFVTEHGIALNLISNEEMKRGLAKIAPCGMESSTYQCVDEIIPSKNSDILAKFHQSFLDNML